MAPAPEDVLEWTADDVGEWLEEKGHSKYVVLFNVHSIDGKALLLLCENDLRSSPCNISMLGDLKRLSLDIRQLKVDQRSSLLDHGYDPSSLLRIPRNASPVSQIGTYHQVDTNCPHNMMDGFDSDGEYHNPMCAFSSNPSSEDSKSSCQPLQPEFLKALLAMAYSFVVTWITAFVMVIVHDRVPDMKKYPPLPDIFLDNVPHIPWAFHMCEVTGTILLFIWLAVLIFHKHRFIILRRFFALCGTVFLLRCCTMLITSLSVPGIHLDCNPKAHNESDVVLFDLLGKMKKAYVIWKGGGLSLQGVRTCGDYMFSGHTVALTMLNFFITEYTPRDIYILHTFTWILNMFGIFFILSGHEHYSIDVFIAFYITSRLFLYYHTLANNQSLMQRDTGRTRIWFPLFSFFESDVDGIVPNEFDTPEELLTNIIRFLKSTIRLAVNLIRAAVDDLLLSYHDHRAIRSTPSLHNSSSRRHKNKSQ